MGRWSAPAKAAGVCPTWGSVKFDLYESSSLKPSPRTMRESLSRSIMKAHEASSEKETWDGASYRLANDTAKLSREEEWVNDELLTMVEREVLSWPAVSKETVKGGRDQNGFWVLPATVYRFGGR